MKQVHVLKFTVSNAASNVFSEDFNTAWYQKCIRDLKSPEDIEHELNSFLQNIPSDKIYSITPTMVTEHRHNNGRGDTNVLYYTIVYEKHQRKQNNQVKV